MIGVVRFSCKRAAIHSGSDPRPHPHTMEFEAAGLASALATHRDNELRLPFAPYLQPELLLEETPVRAEMIASLCWVLHTVRPPETLHLSVALLDRYLASRRMPPGDTALVVATTAFLAAKFLEASLSTPSPEVFVSRASQPIGSLRAKVSADAVLRFEWEMFAALDFGVASPTAFGVAQILLAQQDGPPPLLHPRDQHAMVAYLLELALVFGVYGCDRPSLLASAAVSVSQVWGGAPLPGNTAVHLELPSSLAAAVCWHCANCVGTQPERLTDGLFHDVCIGVWIKHDDHMFRWPVFPVEKYPEVMRSRATSVTPS